MQQTISFDCLAKTSCEESSKVENVYWIGVDRSQINSISWSNCCLSCLNDTLCQAFTFDRLSLKCYLKSMTNSDPIIDQRYESARLRWQIHSNKKILFRKLSISVSFLDKWSYKDHHEVLISHYCQDQPCSSIIAWIASRVA